jgi:hypothetical protein
VVVTVNVSAVVPLLEGVVGLKLHTAPSGRPAHPSETVPGTAAVTLKVNVASCPCFAVALLVPGVMLSSPLIVVASVAVLLLGLTSPPPETVAVLVTLAWMFAGTFTVSVIGG